MSCFLFPPPHLAQFSSIQAKAMSQMRAFLIAPVCSVHASSALLEHFILISTGIHNLPCGKRSSLLTLYRWFSFLYFPQCLPHNLVFSTRSKMYFKWINEWNHVFSSLNISWNIIYTDTSILSENFLMTPAIWPFHHWTLDYDGKMINFLILAVRYDIVRQLLKYPSLSDLNIERYLFKWRLCYTFSGVLKC